MHHFFAMPEQIGHEEIQLTGGDVAHIKNVLRMKPGTQISVYDGAYKEYICEITELGDEMVRARILKTVEQKRELASKLTLFQGLPKGDKMDLIIQKAVELGACRIVPVRMKRCVVKLDEKKAAAKVTRWNEIARSAAKQSGRGILPEVAPVMDFTQALLEAEKLDVRLAPYEYAENMAESKERIFGILPGQSVGIFIGPEGGFEETEIAEAQKHGAALISLGRRILRTETAGLCVLSILMFALEQ